MTTTVEALRLFSNSPCGGLTQHVAGYQMGGRGSGFDKLTAGCRAGFSRGIRLPRNFAAPYSPSDRRLRLRTFRLNNSAKPQAAV